MPNRHSNNNTAKSYFTHAEKERLEYGTQRQRIGKDSLLKFSDCALCLQTARDPMICTRGHLYCRECIFENILAQKNEIRRLTAIAHAQDVAKTVDAERKEAALQQAVIAEFESSQSKLVSSEAPRLISGISTFSLNKDRSCSTLENSVDCNALVLHDKDTLSAIERYNEITTAQKEKAMVKMKELEKEASKPALPSFWIPSLTPSVKESTPIEIKKNPVCTIESNPHTISVKNITSVNFTKSDADDGLEKYICPSCVKGLNNAVKLSVIKSCGHVICNLCIDKFVKKNKKCLSCDKKVKLKDIIPLHCEGTGFAGGGQVMVIKEDIAFH